MGYALGGVTRGIVVGIGVGIVIWAVMLLDVPLTIHDPLAIAYFGVASAIMLSLIGIMVAVWSDKFDNQAAVQNFIITPLVFLSGTFYSVEHLSGVFAAASQVNPFFYLIDGFRYGFIGESDSSVILGAAVVAAIDAALWLCCYLMFARGYKLKT
jgi:ABC-2 type transport system permease protein